MPLLPLGSLTKTDLFEMESVRSQEEGSQTVVAVPPYRRKFDESLLRKCQPLPEFAPHEIRDR